MPIFNITAGADISYSILRNYHVFAQIECENRLANGLDLGEEDYEFSVQIDSKDELSAKELFIEEITKLNDLGIVHHLGYLMYISKNIVSHEGAYVECELPFDRLLVKHLDDLEKLLFLKGDCSNIHADFVHKSFNKDFEGYLSVNNESLLQKFIALAIDSQIQAIHENPQWVHYEINGVNIQQLHNDLNLVKDIKIKLSKFKESTFRLSLLYTIVKTLADYLTENSPLNPNSNVLTNDMARAIYIICKLNNLITITHEMEIEKINYIRAVLNNKKGIERLNATLVGN